jgi:hypothetical protein
MLRTVLARSALPRTAAALAARSCTGGGDIPFGRRAAAPRTMSSVSSADLVPILHAELEDEHDNGASTMSKDLLDLQDGLKSVGFEVSSEAGSSTTVLRRVAADERVEIEFNCDPDDAGGAFEGEDGEDDGEEAPAEHPFSVTVIKGDDDALQFHCIATDNVEVHRITLPSDGPDDSDAGYMGPPFHELDEELQQAFNMYLFDRDIDSNLAEYIHMAVAHKESTEYCRWLGNVAKFVQK